MLGALALGCVQRLGQRLDTGGLEHAVQRVGEPPAAGRADQGRTVERRVAGPVAAQGGRVGQAQPADELTAQAGPGKLLVAVGHDAPLSVFGASFDAEPTRE